MTPDDVGMPYEDVELLTKDKVKLRCYLIREPNGEHVSHFQPRSVEILMTIFENFRLTPGELSFCFMGMQWTTAPTWDMQKNCLNRSSTYFHLSIVGEFKVLICVPLLMLRWWTQIWAL